MRVIAGEFRSRRLLAPPGLSTRPTPDRLRESLFSILQQRLEGRVFVDAYAGSGAVGIEALSRGARRCVFLERDRDALRALRENLRALQLGDRATVIPADAARHVAEQDAAIVFLDPPYSQAKAYEQCLAALDARPPELVLVQHDARFVLPPTAALRPARTLRQGDNVVTFLEPNLTPP